jgi:hypothetical protein
MKGDSSANLGGAWLDRLPLSKIKTKQIFSIQICKKKFDINYVFWCLVLTENSKKHVEFDPLKAYLQIGPHDHRVLRVLEGTDDDPLGGDGADGDGDDSDNGDLPGCHLAGLSGYPIFKRINASFTGLSLNESDVPHVVTTVLSDLHTKNQNKFIKKDFILKPNTNLDLDIYTEETKQRTLNYNLNLDSITKYINDIKPLLASLYMGFQAVPSLSESHSSTSSTSYAVAICVNRSHDNFSQYTNIFAKLDKKDLANNSTISILVYRFTVDLNRVTVAPKEKDKGKNINDRCKECFNAIITANITAIINEWTQIL